jgi:hypothetical protein
MKFLYTLCQIWGRCHLQLRVIGHKNGKDIPAQAWAGPNGSNSWRLPEFTGSWHVKVAILSALRTIRLCSPGKIPGTYFSERIGLRPAARQVVLCVPQLRL